MTARDASAGSPSVTSTAAPAVAVALHGDSAELAVAAGRALPRGRPADYHLGAGARQPLAATWPSLLPAIAPAPLAAATTFAPAPAVRLAAVAAS
jgi:hypothetical protein